MSALPCEALRRLREDGFCIVCGPVPAKHLSKLAGAYDEAMAEADPTDRREGSTTVRVHNFVTRASEFDPIYLHPPLLSACSEIIGRSYKLSSMLGRTLLPGRPAQELHADCTQNDPGGPMAGFILMIDEFRDDNGATRFAPGSHRRTKDPAAPVEFISASGPAGAMIIYNGSVMHGHGANVTREPRRSIQGAFIPREAASATNFAGRINEETLRRIGPLAKYLLAIEV